MFTCLLFGLRLIFTFWEVKNTIVILKLKMLWLELVAGMNNSKLISLQMKNSIKKYSLIT